MGKLNQKSAARAQKSTMSLDQHDLLAVLRALRKGDFSVRLPSSLSGIDGEIAEAFNDVVDLNERTSKEFQRLGDFVGKEGKITHRAKLANRSGDGESDERRPPEVHGSRRVGLYR
jgi:methyl-accepting chemotaxis protein